jgi:hypothetical protein
MPSPPCKSSLAPQLPRALHECLSRHGAARIDAPIHEGVEQRRPETWTMYPLVAVVGRSRHLGLARLAQEVHQGARGTRASSRHRKHDSGALSDRTSEGTRHTKQ